MLHNFPARLFIVTALCLAAARPAPAESLGTAGKQITAGIVIVAVALGAGIIFLIVHEKHKSATITGCVTTGAGGLSVTNEKDNRLYALSGNPPGIKPGDRMTLEGKHRKNGAASVFEARSVTKDLGLCHP